MCEKGLPSTQMTPPSVSGCLTGVMRSRVISSLRIVVLPEPEGPMSVTRSPGSMSKLNWSSTWRSPNDLLTRSNLMIGSVV